MTVIEESSKLDMVMIVICTIAFGCMLWVVGSYQFFEKPRQYQQSPCSQFEALPLSEVPARCITPQGGFKEQS